MRISHRNNFWVVQDLYGNEVALFKSFQSLADYIQVTAYVRRLK